MGFKIITLLLFILFAETAISQNSVDVFIHSNKSLPSQLKYSIKEKNSNNTYRINRGIDYLINDLWNFGFIEVQVDSIWVENEIKHYFLELGRQFFWFKVSRVIENSESSQEYGIEIPILHQEPVSVQKFHSFHTEILSDFADIGYPYASIQLDSVEIQDSLIEAKLIINPGDRIFIDSIVSRSEDLVNEKVLWRLTGFSKGDWYNHTQILKAQKNLQFSGILSDNQPIETGFFKDKAWLYLRPKKSKSNRVDGIIGLAPLTASGIPQLSGEFNLQLNNALRQMESIIVQWRAPGNGSQKLLTQIAWPYFLGSPLGFSGKLDLYKKDTSYLNLGANGGLRYSFVPGIWIDVLFERRQSSDLNSDPQSIINEFSLNMSKLSWQIDKRDKRFNPSKGWMIRNQTGYGIKVSPDENLVEQSIDYYEIDLSSDIYIPIYRSWSGFVRLNAGYRSGDLAENEKYKIGGANHLRGFQEENFSSSTYSTAVLEIRYNFASGSNVHLFVDGGYLDSSIVPYSPGIGLSLETRAGLLSLDYALGQIVGETFSLQSGLIHLGIQSNF